ncbi:CG11983 [Drosophila busckii]|uniref:CG11983 n=1 Tax=Drosophila busckii TaxID=30019 RepID=A0A0M3QY60_DROBS|nr:uncharacterized protein LOC108602414 [Drosophila busckii]ALC47113.1 CG11983 [Drosophila busckii]
MATISKNFEILQLTEVVREHYMRYLERQLQENVCAWAASSRNHHKPTAWACITLSVKTLESRALKACQAALLYQRAMIKMIAAVRRNTQECRLADSLFKNMQQEQSLGQDEETLQKLDNSRSTKQFVDKATQTLQDITNNDSYASYTLGEKMDLFQRKFLTHESQKEEPPIEVNGEARTPILSTEDTVAQELAKLFDDEPTDLNAIFGIEVQATATGATQLPYSEPRPADVKAAQASPTTPQPASHRKTHIDLRSSRWPCELYAQRRLLSACLVRLLDADWRCEHSLRYKFNLLFGEDSDDEFSTQISSPSIDLVDEVLLASCILRIRPWIVRHLMPPLQEGLIGNRFLFKKLAKTLAHNIVLINPYASEQHVKLAIEHMFCMLPRGVQSALDLDMMPGLVVDRFEC